ncbi:MAG: formate dehydrogenase accessory protein FdhE [Clostridia bacterium]|nr:formate dehydrogenase accessory protein FdhE [Clostridia bacterium]MCL6522586.1 formate dehydrogenase accessory protein FdhE [Bacillota bacterium]
MTEERSPSPWRGPREAVLLYRELASWRRARLPGMPSVDPEELALALAGEEDSPLARRLPWREEARRQVRQLAGEAAAIIAAHQPSLAAAAAALAKWLEREEALEAAGHALASEDAQVEELARRASLHPALAAFAFEQAAAVVHTRLAAEAGAPLARRASTGGSCPVCGRVSNLSRLEGKAGERHLYCAHCDLSWRYARIGCPRCGNEEQELLRELVSDDVPGVAVVVCDRCRRYTKRVDLRRVEPPEEWLVADVETLYLDMLAAEEGFLPVHR